MSRTTFSFLAACLVAGAAAQTRISSLTGEFRRHVFHSNVLGNARNVTVWLPPGYDTEPNRRYPVFYMHDGQNLFDGMTSFLPNQEWRVDEAAQALVEAKAIEPLIVVGIDNAGAERANEYLSTRAEGMGGKGDLYGRMLVEELKPFIDRTYRTKTGPADTALGGSSLGGLVTMHLGLRYPQVFGKLAVVSPSVWWAGREILREVDALKRKPRQRIWLDVGTAEGDPSKYASVVADAAALRDALVRKGWTPGRDLLFYEDRGAHHNEAAWSSRIGMILMYLFRR